MLFHAKPTLLHSHVIPSFGRLRALFISGLSIVLGAGALLGAAGCGGSGQTRKKKRDFQQTFRRIFKKYQGFETEKSLALARDSGGNWAYGFARGQEGELAAVNKAKQQCEKQRARYEVEARCRTYAVGDEITGDAALVEE
jgi:hypothetical protein